jgi:peptide/nickel transport system ATP-binding protein
MSDAEPLLEVTNLKKYFSQNVSIVDTLLRRETESIQAVDDVSFSLYSNDSIGVIGESGCGKTTLLKTLMRLHTPTEGELVYKGNPISEFTKKEMKNFRKEVQMIFQDPFNSIDPKLTVEETLTEPLKVHNMGNHEERVLKALDEVELNPPEKYVSRLPKQLSGGEKQRVSIARAIILEPEIILADEPVSMLDVSTQASVLNLLSDLIDDLGVSMIYISHDLSTVSYVCDEINVMYLGRIVENAPTRELLNDPIHPYTQALINAIPLPDPHGGRERTTLSGAPRDPIGLGQGCRFRDRCPEKMDICEETPAFLEVQPDHATACHLYYDHEEYLGRQEGKLDDAHASRSEELPSD